MLTCNLINNFENDRLLIVNFIITNPIWVHRSRLTFSSNLRVSCSFIQSQLTFISRHRNWRIIIFIIKCLKLIERFYFWHFKVLFLLISLRKNSNVFGSVGTCFIWSCLNSTCYPCVPIPWVLIYRNRRFVILRSFDFFRSVVFLCSL